MERRDSVEDSLCCLILLLRQEKVAEMLALLPDGRRTDVEEKLHQLAAIPRQDIAERFRKLRQADVADPVAWMSLPAQLRRWLSNPGHQANG